MEDPVERDDERELFKQPGREQRLGLHQPMPVRGYKPQSSDNLNLVNAGKELEAALIAYLAKLAALDGTDKRMLALAKSNVQQGCMWAWRAVFQPSED